MTRQQREPIWPFLGVLTALFVLCVTMPRSWERSAEKAPWEVPGQASGVSHRVEMEPARPEVAARATLDAAASASALALAFPSPLTAEISLPAAMDYRTAETAARIAALVGEPETPASENASPAEPSVEAPVAELSQAAPSAPRPDPAEPVVPESAPDGENTQSPPPAAVAEEAMEEPSSSVATAEPVAEIPVADSPLWPAPHSLLAKLEAVARHPEIGTWAAEVSGLVKALGEAAGAQQSAVAVEIAGKLRAEGQKADVLASQLDPAVAGELRRLEHALARRLDIWNRVLVAPETASAPPAWAELLRNIEQYEALGSRNSAAQLAAAGRLLAESASTECRQIAERLEVHYRNANLRVAVTEDLLNRLMPERAPEYQWVCDRVLGKPVHGSSVTMSKVAVRLIPDPNRWRLALNIEGIVNANTWSSSGPATFYSDSASAYQAWKEIELRLDGARSQPVQLRVDNETQLRAVRTDLDPIPVLGGLVNEVARSQYDRRQPEARAEVEFKVAHRAGIQIDREASVRLDEANHRIRQRFVGLLAGMGIETAVVESQTTAQRLTARLRMAGDNQLGANTPRPQAPGGSLASVQVHESAINNLLAGLELDGQTLSMPELRQRIAEKLARPELADRSGESDDVTVTFADRDAVMVRCVDGEMHVELALRSLTKPPRRWSDFRLRARYKPQAHGLAAELVREGVVELSGARLSARNQIPLRSVASKIFAPDKPLRLTPTELTEDSRLAGIAITQFVMADGWLGVACGAAAEVSGAAASSSDVASRPATVR